MNTSSHAKQVFDAMLRHSIGIDPWFSDDTPKYPPHNIEQTAEDRYRLTLAVAGFDRDDIEITLKNDLLTITGSIHSEESSSKVLYRGIAFRNFQRQFKIGENVIINSASMNNGLLIIDLKRIEPESERTKVIPILA